MTMVFSGWFVPPTAPEVPTAAVPKKPSPPPTPPKKNKFGLDEWVYIEMVEDILREGNKIELQWLLDHLEDGVRIMNVTNRFLKSEPFIRRIKAAQEKGE